jgi:hypothetical protein
MTAVAEELTHMEETLIARDKKAKISEKLTPGEGQCGP